MTRLPSLPIEPPHRTAQRASARKSFDTAELLWATSDSEPADRAAADETLRVLYLHSAKASLTSLTPDGQLTRWVAPAVWAHEASPALRSSLMAHLLVEQLVTGSVDPTVPLEAIRREAAGLLDLAEATQRAVERARARKLMGIGAVIVVAIAISAVTTSVVARVAAPVDLAKGRPWTASSKLTDCHPDREECGGAKTAIFFHTLEEENPWVQIDLQTAQSFSSATIENRLDVALERAIPLVLEVSTDGVTWKEVARREKKFEKWKPSFPTQTARFVRAKVPRRSILHLTAVRIHP